MFWVYELPNWLFGALVIAAFLVFGLAGLELTRRWVPTLHHEEHSYNDIVGFYLGALTVLYGITLGLLMVGVWTNYSETEAKVDREAQSLGALFRDVSSYPEPARGLLQNDLRGFVREVIDVGWPQQRKGIVPHGAMPFLESFQHHLAWFDPATEGQKVLHAEAYHQFNELVQRRRSRIVSATTGLSSSLWTLVLAGALINLAVTWFFHVKNTTMHRLMTTLTASLLGLMIFLLAAMDRPFRGKLSVGPEPFEIVYDQLMKPVPESVVTK